MSRLEVAAGRWLFGCGLALALSAAAKSAAASSPLPPTWREPGTDSPSAANSVEGHCAEHRPANEVFVETGSTHLESLPPHLVDLRIGETLCLAGKRPERGGEFEGLALVSETNDAVLVVRLVPLPNDLTALVAENRSGADILVSFLVEGLAGTVQLAVSPGRRSERLFAKRVERLVLARLEQASWFFRGRFGGDFSLTPGTAKTVAPPVPDGVLETKRHGTRFGMAVYAQAGVRMFDFSALNEALSQNGYGSLDQVAHPLGGRLELVFQRVRGSFSMHGADTGAARAGNGDSVDTGYFAFGLDVGYEFSPAPLTHWFPFVGLQAASLHLNLGQEHVPVFDGQLGDYADADALQFSQQLFQVGVGFEKAIPFAIPRDKWFWALLVGLRAGYSFPLGTGSWSVTTEEPEDEQSNESSAGSRFELSHGPDLGLGGPFLMLTLGAGVRWAN